ncbi:MAG: VirD4-like conjugal transfer protein, CD1115 family [Eisenbergiella sp.]
MTEDKRKIAAGISVAVLILWYVAGALTNFASSGILSFHPFVCLAAGLSRAGVRCILLLVLLLGALAMGISLKGREGIAGEDRERNFSYSRQGTYGTAGFMQGKERKEVLAADPDVRQVRGTILGTDPESGAVLSLPEDSPLNRNFAICGSQGSMKSRAIARNMIIQCAKRGESMVLTDSKSELYEDTVAYLEEEGYQVRQYNLLQQECSDAWDCLGEIEGGYIDVFVDTIIRNTTDKFDHFYDNVEMDLLKALCLYVYEEYPEGKRKLKEAYNLLVYNSIEKLDAIFENLPVEHPARGPYQLFAKAEKVKGNAVLGLGTRLQIFQNRQIQTITSENEIDLTLPGKQKCAYFCITSDQDSTYDMLATLLISFLFIKLVRFADMQPDRRLPVPVLMILDEFPNIGVIKSFNRRLASARSRQIGIAMFFQNIPQLQNRYPDTEWEELLGGCDTSIFLGCNDLTTATYYSERSGDITVAVSSIRKSLQTMRVTDYVPEYAESSSVGKRKLLLPDELLRFPLSEGLVIIRGHQVLRVKKFDYTKNPESLKFQPRKAAEHVPEWRRRMEMAGGKMGREKEEGIKNRNQEEDRKENRQVQIEKEEEARTREMEEGGIRIEDLLL